MYKPKLHQLIEKTLSKHGKKIKGASALTFAARLGANIDTIHNYFHSLYGEQPNAEAQFEQVLITLIEGYQNRSADLRKRDALRESNTEWLTSSQITGMALYADRFAGTINGVGEKLDYLEELGVNWVHVLPLMDCPDDNNDGGFAVRDFRKVDKGLGDVDDLRKLSSDLHKRDMLLTLDLVLNCTSDQHDWAIKARGGDKRYQRYFYTYPDRSVPDRLEETMPEIFPEKSPGNFTYIPETDSWVMTVFNDYQWDLNYRNPEVFVEMLKVMIFMANLGVDILRMDAPAFIWKRIGTSCQNLWEAHLLLQCFKACTQVVAPAMATIAEATVAPREMVRYFGEGAKAGKECELAYNTTFMAAIWDAIATKDVRLLRKSMGRLPAKPLGTTWITYLRCHDDIKLEFNDQDIYSIGFDAQRHRAFLKNFYTGKYKKSTAKGAVFSNNPKTDDIRLSGTLAALAGLEHAVQLGNDLEKDLACRRIAMMHAVILAYGGLPMLYYGDELGSMNDYTYVQEDDKAYDNRWMHRPIMNWKAAEKRNDPESVQGYIFNSLKHLIQLRKESPEFADRNSISWEESGNDSVLSFLRWDDEGRRTLVLANFSPEGQRLHLDVIRRCGLQIDNVVDRITKATSLVKEDDYFELGAYQCVYLSEDTSA